ncbi:hypothetical protein P170DRAFT_458155 [Aspergillus steynii IBT 23096]|uniref:Phospholipase/carboxylesterase/thioesterase domain-containing protein n=1 Tax=Aspergillus steynii IBT 23096 TaxID=1392250 RepID=A0A2I2FZ91_9EURO|nr:uncharacterized protein P170DRAFT_458155 [Aspergillus steynii IBT 23096]PLB45947.1 hypothetical protein P170DRAFT_458155 [Aspergillus steynii IBT 23096]
MPTKTPSQSDFPSHLTLTLTPPPPSTSTSTSTSSTRPPPNVLILLHGLGDSAPAFTNFARALNLPEALILTLQAPSRLPLDLPGFHWGDDISFDTSTGGLDMDAGFARATKTLVHEVVRDTLVSKCGYALREILILGFGQGGMLGLLGARELAGELAGSVGEKNRTPVLVVAGRESVAVSEGAVRRTQGVFEFVEVRRYARRDDGMPRNREEMMPVMQFFARRLRSWKGVPEGSVEITAT